MDMRLIASLLLSPPPLSVPPGPRMAAVDLPDLQPHVRYLDEVALTMAPTGMVPVAALLMRRGEELVEPGTDRTLHPLLVPLTRSPADGEITGLLRWPGASGGGTKLPLVRTRGPQLALLAPCAEHFVARELVLADANEGTDASDLEALEAFAAACGIAYERGAAASAPGGLAGYLITKVGPFPQEYERLAAGHLAKGSEQAGLIACERSQQCFSAWGRPFIFHANRLTELGRDEEARDLARQALEMPLWTLGTLSHAIRGHLAKHAHTTALLLPRSDPPGDGNGSDGRLLHGRCPRRPSLLQFPSRAHLPAQMRRSTRFSL